MQLTWFGHSAFRLDLPGASVLIDPFFTGNPAFEGDAAAAGKGVSHIVVTHGHGDHVGDTLAIAAANDATVITNYDLCMHLASKGLKKFQPMNTGGTVDLGAFSVTLVRADHSAGMGEAGVAVPVGNANGAIIKAAGEKTLWHMGDTDIFSDMALLAEIHGVEACICPIGDRFTMGARTAALAMTRFVKPKLAIPCHYGSFPIIAQDAAVFVEGLKGSGIEALVPEKGKAATI
ncbi:MULTISPECIES: metal-dependent hydrolase [unclassified Bosea (in: a-proteobacteria)]|uniref:metal-dependent hydrolase n=1 Tax=unclassified Bosea (in: a-proteobacteria) TaxID=2653178 RepID=UPI000F7617BB|nr:MULTISPECIES: metal-dependent hydrolase [unclassified Bosea (in: a-proteobacteria)]AZO77329.1 metal-dependent hydrolase [Bosea sp. Tri-49]RXT22186.1 metal-dependent hydrolase [Bosea sp. Tri-39]RXT32528.1 metal-dependent hydrolase [Bosea sp. Tri-54]